MTQHTRRWRSGRTLTVRVAMGALLATMAVALLVGLLISSIINLRDADRVGEHSQRVLLRVSRTLSEVVDLESGLRGYVITGDPRFLRSYMQASAAIGPNMDALLRDLASSPIEHRRAQELRGEIDAYLTNYTGPLIELVARHQRSAAAAVVSTGEGKRRVDQMRTKVGAIQGVETSRQSLRQRRSRTTAAHAVNVGIVVLIMLVLLVALLAFALQRLVVAPARAVERGHRLTTLLAEASATLDVSLDLARTLPRFGKLLESEFAAWCTIALHDAGGDGSLEVVAGDPDRLPEHALDLIQRRRELREERRLIVPITTRGRTLGLLALGTDASADPYGQDELVCARELARRAALAIDAARLYEQSSATARVLQDSLLPESLPSVTGLEIAARFRPAGRGTRVGGDFYDVFSTGQGTWAILVGDVCGKGAAAAAVTAMVRYTLRAYGPRALSPADALRQLNEAMLQQSHDGRFVTIVYATLDLRSPRPQLTVACGGHPPPLLVRAAGGAEPLAARGTLIGVFDQVQLSEVSRELNEGDALVLYSDGVTEARRGEAFTPQELADVLPGHESAEALAEALDRLATETSMPRADDVAILAVRYVHRSDSLALELPVDVSAPGAARRALRNLDLSPDRLQLATLLTSELVTNAVLHGSDGQEQITVRAKVSDGSLRLWVSDAGAGLSLPPQPAAAESPGYGLALVEQLADSWGVEQGAGNTVWFELS